MEIIKDILSKKLERKLPNGLTEVKEFWKNEQLKVHYFVDENSKLHGEYKFYYKNGQLYERCYFNDGLLHGEWKVYDPDGILHTYKLYENDELIEIYRT